MESLAKWPCWIWRMGSLLATAPPCIVNHHFTLDTLPHPTEGQKRESFML